MTLGIRSCCRPWKPWGAHCRDVIYACHWLPVGLPEFGVYWYTPTCLFILRKMTMNCGFEGTLFSDKPKWISKMIYMDLKGTARENWGCCFPKHTAHGWFHWHSFSSLLTGQKLTTFAATSERTPVFVCCQSGAVKLGHYRALYIAYHRMNSQPLTWGICSALEVCSCFPRY